MRPPNHGSSTRTQNSRSSHVQVSFQATDGVGWQRPSCGRELFNSQFDRINIDSYDAGQSGIEMAKKSPPEPEFVKLQIPVSRELAEELAAHAKELEYTQARVCKVLLNWGVKDRQRIAKWLEIRMTGRRPKGVKPGWLQLSDSSAVRLQVPVPQEIVDRLEEIAADLNHTTVRMAALVIDFTLADDRFLLKFLATRPVKYITRKLGRPIEEYESAETDSGKE